MPTRLCLNGTHSSSLETFMTLSFLPRTNGSALQAAAMTIGTSLVSVLPCKDLIPYLAGLRLVAGATVKGGNLVLTPAQVSTVTTTMPCGPACPVCRNTRHTEINRSSTGLCQSGM